MTRAELQTIVKEFAEAGWAIRDLGTFHEPPSPMIGWDPEGKPFIRAWRGVQDSAAENPFARQLIAQATAQLNRAGKRLLWARETGDPVLLGAAERARGSRHQSRQGKGPGRGARSVLP